jgi:hypothetical protein
MNCLGQYSKQWQYCIVAQVLTLEELLHGAIVKMPPQFGTFKQARKVQQKEVEQKELGFAQCPLLLCLAQQ